MPIREYDCGKCGKHYEIMAPGEAKKITCEKCNTPIDAKLSTFSIGKGGTQKTGFAPDKITIEGPHCINDLVKTGEEVIESEEGEAVVRGHYQRFHYTKNELN